MKTGEYITNDIFERAWEIAQATTVYLNDFANERVDDILMNALESSFRPGITVNEWLVEAGYIYIITPHAILRYCTRPTDPDQPDSTGITVVPLKHHDLQDLNGNSIPRVWNSKEELLEYLKQVGPVVSVPVL
jgi:hypothetical protein